MELNPRYDFIFCGAGASASLMLMALHDRGMLVNKSVLIIDRIEKNGADKTFCFWSKSDEQIDLSLQGIITHTWSEITLSDGAISQLAPYKYHHVAGVDLHRRITELEALYGWTRRIGTVQAIEQIKDDFMVQVDDAFYYGERVFDSRTPNYADASMECSSIYQSFVGWRVRMKSNAVFSQSIRLMDFNVEQQQSTQFMYVLPFSDDTALIELTRFGSSILHPSDALDILRDYILTHFGEFEINDEEVGCIPMTTRPILDKDIPGVIYLGARNFAIKPSTGYAFKRMFYDAHEIAKALQVSESSKVENRSYLQSNSGRFAFYDRLLLDILGRNPQAGKSIFESLFRSNSMERILNFLDEKSRWSDDAVMFYRLPKLPFLKSLWRGVLHHVAFVPSLIMLLCTALTSIAFHTSFLPNAVSCILLFGLVVIGIPHGALDHLLEAKKYKPRELPIFIIKYVAIGALMFLLWQVWPTLSLLLFIIYSSWHFGQADGVHWKMPSIRSFGWGMSVLVYMLGTHADESNAILSEMGVSMVCPEIPAWTMLPWLLIFGFTRNYAGFITASWLMVSCQIPLMITFGLYFIGQHSWVGWKHIQAHLQMTHKRMWLHALPFHAMAWALLAVFFF
ncbi:MAG: beta-carotene 15,15'-dioxygenase, Brp/Blh family, partial [Flavobacteriales bacterium]